MNKTQRIAQPVLPVKKEFVIAVDDASLEIERGINAAISIYTAMEEGPSNPDEFMDGLYFVLTRLEGCNKDLRRIVRDEQSQSSVASVSK